jgi:hypothetical protein
MTLKDKIYKHVYAFYVKATHLVIVFSSAKNHNSNLTNRKQASSNYLNKNNNNNNNDMKICLADS